MYGEIVKARAEERRDVENVVLTGTRVNAYDTSRIYDRLLISSGFHRILTLLPVDTLSHSPFTRSGRKRSSLAYIYA